MLLLPEGQTGAAWKPYKKKVLSEVGEHWIEKFSLYFH
jgi:hypothetical protein